MHTRPWLVALVAIAACLPALASDREAYHQRSAERFVAMFLAADVARNQAITRDDAGSSIELVARFDDIDINRDGIVTRDELTRFIDANFR